MSCCLAKKCVVNVTFQLFLYMRQRNIQSYPPWWSTGGWLVLHKKQIWKKTNIEWFFFQKYSYWSGTDTFKKQEKWDKWEIKGKVVPVFNYAINLSAFISKVRERTVTEICNLSLLGFEQANQNWNLHVLKSLELLKAPVAY